MSLDNRIPIDYICIMTQTYKHKSGQDQVKTCCSGLDKLLETRFFKALCDPNRVAILIRLAEGRDPYTVSQVSECCPINISVVSRHLSMLRDAGILEANKRGKEVYYAVRYKELARTLRAMADAIDSCCPQENDQKSQENKNE